MQSTCCAGAPPVTCKHHPAEDGIAVLIALIVLSIFSLVGLYMMLNATTDVRISDNYESHVQARYAALAGLNHARALLRGLDFSSLLKGPDGIYNHSPGYMAEARTFAFRNPVSWATGRSLNIFDPAGDVSGLQDDGIICAAGTILIPLTGMAQTVPNPYGAGTVTTSRYFVKVSDNNGEATELAGDPSDNPFIDGDGIIVVRSMGVAQTIRETVGAAVRRNSVAVFEARYKHRCTFEFTSPLVIEGNNVNATFNGNAFSIAGGSSPGIGTIDTVTGDSTHPDQVIRAATAGKGSITGGGLPNPSIQDITNSVNLHPEKALLLDPNFLWNFVINVVPQAADYVYNGDQHWSGVSAPYIGSFDSTRPINDPTQDPKIIIVNGDLDVSGNLGGGGLLVVRGNLSCNGAFTYNGLVLVIGAGNVNLGDSNHDIIGGMFVVNLTNLGGGPSLGTPTFSISGSSRITANANAIQMAIGLLPAAQLSFREVTSTIDP